MKLQFFSICLISILALASCAKTSSPEGVYLINHDDYRDQILASKILGSDQKVQALDHHSDPDWYWAIGVTSDSIFTVYKTSDITQKGASSYSYVVDSLISFDGDDRNAFYFNSDKIKIAISSYEVELEYVRTKNLDEVKKFWGMIE